MKCLNCKKNKAVKHPRLGYLPCQRCQDKEEEFSKPKLEHEFTTDRIKSERLEFAADVAQPWHSGTLSKEFLETYGTTGIEATQEQIDNAKYTNKHQKGWWNREKTVKSKRYTKPEAKR